eukprot:1328110-Pyramimonas_sp.AAC.1
MLRAGQQGGRRRFLGARGSDPACQGAKLARGREGKPTTLSRRDRADWRGSILCDAVPRSRN